MSGGAFDYGFYHINDYAKACDDEVIKQLLEDVATLCHDLEWYESGDTGEEDWEESKRVFKDKWFGSSIDQTLRNILSGYCEDAIKNLTEFKEFINGGK